MKNTTILVLLSLGLASAAFAQQPAVPLTLQRVVDMYIQNNLELQAARYRLERTGADQIAARLRPNPGLTVTAENLSVGGPTPFGRLYEVATTYSDTIEIGGKRALRQRVAEQTFSVAEAQFEDTMRRGLAEVKRLYFDALLARYIVEMVSENRATFDELFRVNETRFREGAIPEAELIKVRLERVRFDSAVRQAELNFRQATIRLLQKLGQSDYQTPVSGGLEFSIVNPDRDSLRQAALSGRPDVQAASREVAAAAERLALEHARAAPDLNSFVGYKRVGNDNTVIAGVTVPLRIRDRNQAGIARAEADVKTAQTNLQLQRSRALAEVETAYEGFQAARDQVRTFQDGLLMQVDESRSIALAAYEEGGTDLLPLLEAQRTRTEVRQQYSRTLFDYRASIVDLELAAGKEIQP